MPPQPVGRPIAASEAQQAQIIKRHKAGRSTRWIAEELTLSRRTVTTIVDKLDGTDRTTTKRRQRLGLEPKRKDWRPGRDGPSTQTRDRAFREKPRTDEGSERAKMTRSARESTVY